MLTSVVKTNNCVLFYFHTSGFLALHNLETKVHELETLSDRISTDGQEGSYLSAVN